MQFPFFNDLKFTPFEYAFICIDSAFQKLLLHNNLLLELFVQMSLLYWLEPWNEFMLSLDCFQRMAFENVNYVQCRGSDRLRLYFLEPLVPFLESYFSHFGLFLKPCIFLNLFLKVLDLAIMLHHRHLLADDISRCIRCFLKSASPILLLCVTQINWWLSFLR